jgi:hypothetical protein
MEQMSTSDSGSFMDAFEKGDFEKGIPTRLIMLTIVAFPATRSRKAIWIASAFSMCPGLSYN